MAQMCPTFSIQLGAGAIYKTVQCKGWAGWGLWWRQHLFWLAKGETHNVAKDGYTRKELVWIASEFSMEFRCILRWWAINDCTVSEIDLSLLELVGATCHGTQIKSKLDGEQLEIKIPEHNLNVLVQLGMEELRWHFANNWRIQWEILSILEQFGMKIQLSLMET